MNHKKTRSKRSAYADNLATALLGEEVARVWAHGRLGLGSPRPQDGSAAILRPRDASLEDDGPPWIVIGRADVATARRLVAEAVRAYARYFRSGDGPVYPLDWGFAPQTWGVTWEGDPHPLVVLDPFDAEDSIYHLEGAPF
jgi:hypothetical protein